jgi:alkanesulfonate monooxygenase
MSHEYLWYIPNTVDAGHRLDNVGGGWADLDLSTELARLLEDHGWGGALIGTGWGRPDTLTIATAIAARTTTFKPLAAIRPGYWQPAHFASAAATLDHLASGRLLVNIVSGQDNLAAYGDAEGDQPQRYARTMEFLQITRRLWAEENVTFRGDHFTVEGSSLRLKPFGAADGRHPRLYFGGASAAAERVSAAAARAPPGWSARPTRWPPPCGSTPTLASRISCCPTRPTKVRLPASATVCCPYCACRPLSEG